MQSTRLVRRRPNLSQPDICSAFCSLYIAARGLSTSHVHHAIGGSNNSTPNPVHSAPPGTTKRSATHQKFDLTKVSLKQKPGYVGMTAAERAAAAKARADELLAEQNQKRRQGPVQGGLAEGNIFEDGEISGRDSANVQEEEGGLVRDDRALSARSPSNMAPRIDPRPNARARWTRMMVIRNVRRRGRLTREMRIARTERSHLSRSRFLPTSIKKLSPLARQIAGKSLDQAILQMRFSKKKAAQEVRKHLIQARNEAIVSRGMGLSSSPSQTEALSPRTDVASPQAVTSPRLDALIRIRDTLLREKAKQEEKNPDRKPKLEMKQLLDKKRDLHTKQVMVEIEKLKEKLAREGETTSTESQHPLTAPSEYEIVDPSGQAPFKRSLPKKGPQGPKSTDIYIAEAWVNRGTYEKEMSPRARGRTDILRHPHTGISVLLKEEQTRTREKREKEIKAVRKRLNGKLWTQMPDRPIVRQSQYVLW